MQSWKSTWFRRVIVLIVLSTLLTIPSSPAVHANTLWQSGICTPVINGPYPNGTSVTAVSSFTCTKEVGRMVVEGTLTAPDGTITTTSATCYLTTICSAQLSAPLSYGIWTALAKGYYQPGAEIIPIAPISYSTRINQPLPRYWLKLAWLACGWKNDRIGADEPRIYVNGRLVWSDEHFFLDEREDLTNVPRIPFTDSQLAIVIKEYDAWPGSTDTLNPNPAYAYTSQAGKGIQVLGFDGGGAIYSLGFTVVYEQ